MVHDVAAQLPSNVDFLLVDQEEPESVMLHVLEKTYLPVKMFVDNCEPGQSCQAVGDRLYQQPDHAEVPHNSFVWLPFARAYVVKVVGQAPPETSLQVTSVLLGYDPNVVLCKIADALGGAKPNSLP
jgi:hypothetical protein